MTWVDIVIIAFLLSAAFAASSVIVWAILDPDDDWDEG